MKRRLIETPRAWAKLKVRARLKGGWHAWVSPTRQLMWARFRKDKAGEHSQLDTAEIAPDELEVLDEVLLEAM